NEMLNARAAAAGTERDNALNEVEGTVCVRPLRGGVDRISGTNGVNGGGTRTGNPTTPRRPNVPLPSAGSKGIIYEKDRRQPQPQPQPQPPPPPPHSTKAQVHIPALIT